MSNDTSTRLVALGVATLHEASGREAVMRDVRLMVGGAFAGPAVTVSLPAGDNVGIHLALETAQPGEVLCVGSAGRGTYGVFGDLLHASAAVRRVAGLVIDDGIRDLGHLPPVPPVAARSVSAHGTLKRRLRRPVGGLISISGVLVAPGDWIVGDRDGVCVIPASEVEEVIELAAAREAKEERLRQVLLAGETTRAALDLPTHLPASVL